MVFLNLSRENSIPGEETVITSPPKEVRDDEDNTRPHAESTADDKPRRNDNTLSPPSSDSSNCDGTPQQQEPAPIPPPIAAAAIPPPITDVALQPPITAAAAVMGGGMAPITAVATAQKKARSAQRTLTSIFAAKSALPKPATPIPASKEVCPPTGEATPPQSMEEAPPPQLNSLEEDGEQVVCFDIPQQRELTEMEKFQLRLNRHMKTHPHVSKKTSSTHQKEGVASILSKETIAKFSETPGEV